MISNVVTEVSKSRKNGDCGGEMDRSKYSAVVWIPIKKPKHRHKPLHGGNRLAMAMMVTSPTTTSSISATRHGTMITLTYSVHAAQVISYITVSATQYGYTIGQAGGQSVIPLWSADLAGQMSQDAYLPPTTVDIAAYLAIPGPPVMIDVAYYAANGQNLGHLTTNA